VIFNNEKIGFKRFKVDLFLKEHSKRYEIIKYIKSFPNLRYFSTSVGLCDMEFEFIIKDIDKLINLIEKIDRKYPNSIKKYDYYGDMDNYIETFLPKMEFK
jgi:hypothetical protein